MFASDSIHVTVDDCNGYQFDASSSGLGIPNIIRIKGYAQSNGYANVSVHGPAMWSFAPQFVADSKGLIPSSIKITGNAGVHGKTNSTGESARASGVAHVASKAGFCGGINGFFDDLDTGLDPEGMPVKYPFLGENITIESYKLPDFLRKKDMKCCL